MKEEEIEKGDCGPPTWKVFSCGFVRLEPSGTLSPRRRQSNTLDALAGFTTGPSGWRLTLSSARWLGTAWFKSDKITKTDLALNFVHKSSWLSDRNWVLYVSIFSDFFAWSTTLLTQTLLWKVFVNKPKGATKKRFGYPLDQVHVVVFKWRQERRS